jgi:CRISPR-associated protein Csx17
MPKHESRKPEFDWRVTSFEGSRREQLRRWRALSLRQRLEALDRLSDLARPFERQETPQAATAQPPEAAARAAAVREPPAPYRGKRTKRGKTPGTT